jgi:hypothetical protein
MDPGTWTKSRLSTDISTCVEVQWRMSSLCDANGCVEVGWAKVVRPDHDEVEVPR